MEWLALTLIGLGVLAVSFWAVSSKTRSDVKADDAEAKAEALRRVIAELHKLQADEEHHKALRDRFTRP